MYIYIYIYIYTHIHICIYSHQILRSAGFGMQPASLEPRRRIVDTVDFRNFIVLFWAETLAH